MGTRKIRKIAVLGSGLMGSGIALHFAGSGFDVLLLDLKSEGEKPNSIVQNALQKSVSTKPSNVLHQSALSRIQTGNFDDDLVKLKEVDWIIEVVVENLDIKKSLYEKIEKFRRNSTIITSNTSGIPIHLLVEGRTEDFKKSFCGTHFFNPPRYLKLVEIIPTRDTDPQLVSFGFLQQIFGEANYTLQGYSRFYSKQIGSCFNGKSI